MATKLTDIQDVEISVVNGTNVGSVTVTHNLEDQNGDELTPDVVIPEFITHSASPADPASFGFVVTRSTPENGTFLLTIAYSDDNATGNTITVTVRVTSMYLHSIQSSDHTA